ncbi:Arv1-domain-containing protein [Amylocystis lapponica]|nr:Arv1-domain-containing protein [Amylocystis lapponica]
MPICTSCTHPTPFLYTIYNSTHNLRLEQCTACHAFADPYVEHDTLTLLLDLILLKRDVYRHLLFNRGLGARKAGQGTGTGPDADAPTGAASTARPVAPSNENDTAYEWERTKTRWHLILQLATALITVDAFIRWTHLSSRHPFGGSRVDVTTWNRETTAGFLRIFAGCLVETAAFHGGVVLACYIVMKCLGWARTIMPSLYADPQMPGIRREFRYSHVPLTLLYSSFTKLFLLFLLSVWRPAPTPQVTHAQSLHPNATTFTHPLIVGALEILDEDKLDREWVVRNVLGGMSAGFGLRVAGLVSDWVGVGLGGDTAGEIWLAYSIP